MFPRGLQRAFAIFGITSALIVAGGCKNSKTAQTSNDVKAEPAAPKLASLKGQCEPTKKNHEVQVYDSSGDGRVDVRKLYLRRGEGVTAPLILACREADLNNDGRADTVRTYDSDGRPVREESDSNFDGKMDHFTTFASGLPAVEESDTRYTGRIDTKVFYEDGVAVRAEIDTRRVATNGIWRPDRFEYLERGHVVRVGRDTDGDGRVDRWDQDEQRLFGSEKSIASEQKPANSAPNQ